MRRTPANCATADATRGSPGRVQVQRFDYELPEELIAQRPPEQRGDARLMVLDGVRREQSKVRNLAEFLPEGALVVVNDSRVVPARIDLRRGDGRAFELLVCAPRPGQVPGSQLKAWVRGAKRLRVGDVLCGSADGEAEPKLRYVGDDPVDSRARRFELLAGDLFSYLQRAGSLPLPPYVARPEGANEEDLERYQTIFAREPGSVAAPTAGLHFSDAWSSGLEIVSVTLHVGPGTFLPMTVDDARDHRVGAESIEISGDAAAQIEAARASGRPIVAVGTTVTRTLEGVAKAHGGRIVAGAAEVDLVITPEHEWQVVDGLLTNFHLPKSSLLMLVCSFAGFDPTMAAYREAVALGFRFYSYGDAMFIRRRG